MAHPQHPNCSACSKALFKSPAAAKVKPTDPYMFCRNAACGDYAFRNDRPADPKKPTPEQLAKAVQISVYNRAPAGRAAGMTVAAATVVLKQAAKKEKAAAATPEPAPAASTEPAKPPATKPVSKRGVPRRAVPLADAPAKPKEAEPLAKARVRVRAILDAVTVGQPKESISLVLAILNQESGNQKAAEVLIDEFELDKKYGLLKFT
jgi:hypothetical protein